MALNLTTFKPFGRTPSRNLEGLSKWVASRERPSGLTRFPLEQMLALVRRDVRDRREDVGAVSRGPLDAVAVVDASLAGLVIDIEILKVVVEVDAASAEVATKEGGVGGEDGGDVDMALPAERDGETCLPLVKVTDDGLCAFPRRELEGQTSHDQRLVRTWIQGFWGRTSPRNQATR